MKTVQTTFAHVGGLAKVEVHPTQPKVRVIIQADTEKNIPAKTVVLEKEKCPEYVRSGIFLVDLNQDCTKMYSLRPEKGLFKVKVKNFPAGVDKDGKPKEPAPKVNKGEYGQYLTFIVNFEIIEGEYKGMIIPGSFSFDFIETQEEVDGAMRSCLGLKIKKNSPRNDQLVSFLEAAGVIRLIMPFKENPLPMLQRYMLKEGRTIVASVKRGWIDSLSEE